MSPSKDDSAAGGIGNRDFFRIVSSREIGLFRVIFDRLPLPAGRLSFSERVDVLVGQLTKPPPNLIKSHICSFRHYCLFIYLPYNSSGSPSFAILGETVSSAHFLAVIANSASYMERPSAGRASGSPHAYVILAILSAHFRVSFRLVRLFTPQKASVINFHAILY